MPRSKRPSERSLSWRIKGVRVEIDQLKLGVVVRNDMAHELKPILRKIRRRARAIVKTQCKEYSTTGNLRDSIETTRIKKVNQFAVRGSVEAGGAKAPYAYWVHEGAPIHPIPARPDNPTGNLRFYWKREDKIFVGPLVKNHPGVKHPVPFLKMAGESVGVGVTRKVR